MSFATAASIPLYNVAGRWTARRGAGFVLGAGYAAWLAAMDVLAAAAEFGPTHAFWPALALYARFH